MLIYCEGLPGLGKTTAAVGLATTPDVVLVAENNPTPADHDHVANLDPAAAAAWYLRAEKQRSTYAANLLTRGAAYVICDKSALATLAYTYAATHIGIHPATLYRNARDLYLSHVRPHLPADAATVVFTGPVELGKTRRATKPDRAIRPLWYDPAFLHAQAHFYSNQAPDLSPRLATIDASTSHTQILADLADLLHLPAPVLTAGQLDPVDHHDLPDPFRSTAERIGSTVLGRALGQPFPHLASHAQAFERHLLIATHHQATAVHLQADQWTTPLRHHPTRHTRHTRPTRPA